MHNNIILPNLKSTSNLSNIKNIRATKNILKPKLLDPTTPEFSSVIVNGNYTINNLKLIEQEYSFEELMKEAEKTRQESLKKNSYEKSQHQISKTIEKKYELNLSDTEKNMLEQFYKIDAKDGKTIEAAKKAFYLLNLEEMIKNKGYLLKIEEYERKYNQYINPTSPRPVSEFNEYQQIMTADLKDFRLYDEKYNIRQYEGKTINEIYQLIKNKYGEKNDFAKYLNDLIEYGFGELKLIEYVVGDDGFDAVVFQDSTGEYLINYPSSSGTEDTLYDAYPILEDAAPELFSGSYDNFLDVAKDIKGIDLKPYLTEMENIYESQNKQAKNLAEKYYYLSKKNGTKINISGYSLGGSLAEKSFLHIAKKYGTNHYMGELILFNAYHNRLSGWDENLISEYEDTNIYAVEGDAISTYFGHLGDDTKYIKNENWKEMYSDTDGGNSLVGNITSVIDGISEVKNMNYSDVINFFGGENLNGSTIADERPLDSDFFNSVGKNFNSILYGPHLISNVNQTHFYFDGSIIEGIGVDFSEISETLFDYNGSMPDARAALRDEMHKILYDEMILAINDSPKATKTLFAIKTFFSDFSDLFNNDIYDPFGTSHEPQPPYNLEEYYNNSSSNSFQNQWDDTSHEPSYTQNTEYNGSSSSSNPWDDTSR